LGNREKATVITCPGSILNEVANSKYLAFELSAKGFSYYITKVTLE
jgi:hypothetical protein